MHKFVLSSAAFFGGTAVAAGAFAAHGLKARLDEKLLAAFITGADYQMYHALALLAIGLIMLVKPQWRGLSASAACMVLGILLFSGSLYALALSGVSMLGIITPFGGLALLLGWALLFLSVVRT